MFYTGPVGTGPSDPHKGFFLLMKRYISVIIIFFYSITASFSQRVYPEDWDCGIKYGEKDTIILDFVFLLLLVVFLFGILFFSYIKRRVSILFKIKYITISKIEASRGVEFREKDIVVIEKNEECIIKEYITAIIDNCYISIAKVQFKNQSIPLYTKCYDLVEKKAALKDEMLTVKARKRREKIIRQDQEKAIGEKTKRREVQLRNGILSTWTLKEFRDQFGAMSRIRGEKEGINYEFLMFGNCAVSFDHTLGILNKEEMKKCIDELYVIQKSDVETGALVYLLIDKEQLDKWANRPL